MKKYLLALLAIAAIAGCHKNVQDPMPVLSNTGENIAACRVNGNTFVVKDGDYIPGGWLGPSSRTIVLAYPIDTSGSGYHVYVQSAHCGLLFNFKFSGIPGTFPIATLDTIRGSGEWADTKGNKVYTSTFTNPGTVTVTYIDSATIAGKFSFDAVNSTGIVHITDGQFDIKLRH